MSKIHELKTWPEYFNALFGHKNFELRKNDRDYKVGDLLILREFEPKQATYTGRYVIKTVVYIFLGGMEGVFGLADDMCIIALGKVDWLDGSELLNLSAEKLAKEVREIWISRAAACFAAAAEDMSAETQRWYAGNLLGQSFTFIDSPEEAAETEISYWG